MTEVSIVHEEPIELPMGNMPQWARENWDIYNVLRSDAQVAYASKCANAEVPGHVVGGGVPYDAAKSSAWCDAFDRAALRWLAVNPRDPVWKSGKWPEGADIFLGASALEEARALMRKCLGHLCTPEKENDLSYQSLLEKNRQQQAQIDLLQAILCDVVKGFSIIENRLAVAVNGSHADAPFPLNHEEAAIHHAASASAYQHALEMCNSQSLTAFVKNGFIEAESTPG